MTTHQTAITLDKKRTVSELAQRVVFIAEARGLHVLNVEGQLWTFGTDRVWTPQSDALYTIVAELDIEARQMRDELQAQLDEQLERGALSKIQEERLRRRAQAAEANATTIGRNKGAQIIVNNITHLPGIENATEAEMYAYRNKITCADGRTYDLATGQSYPAKPEDRISLLVPHSPADVPTPTIDAFLLESSGGDEVLAEFKLQIAATTLTGRNSKKMWFLHGLSNSGKSAFVDLCRRVHGPDGAGEIDGSVLGMSKQILPDLAMGAIANKRCVTASELGRGDRLDTQLAKRLAGGSDKLTYRKIRGNPMTADIAFQVIVATNFLPRLEVDDEAMMARMRIVPFYRTYSTPNPSLEADMAAELPGFLYKLIQAAHQLNTTGLYVTCPASNEAMDDYRASLVEGARTGRRGNTQADAELVAFADTVTVDPSSQELVPNADIYVAYQAWAEANGVPVSAQVSQRRLTDALKAKGAVLARTKKTRGLRGIILDNASDAAA